MIPGDKYRQWSPLPFDGKIDFEEPRFLPLIADREEDTLDPSNFTAPSNITPLAPPKEDLVLAAKSACADAYKERNKEYTEENCEVLFGRQNRLIPFEVLCEVASHITTKEILNLFLVCKPWERILKSKKSSWLPSSIKLTYPTAVINNAVAIAKTILNVDPAYDIWQQDNNIELIAKLSEILLLLHLDSKIFDYGEILAELQKNRFFASKKIFQNAVQRYQDYVKRLKHYLTTKTTVLPESNNVYFLSLNIFTILNHKKLIDYLQSASCKIDCLSIAISQIPIARDVTNNLIAISSIVKNNRGKLQSIFLTQGYFSSHASPALLNLLYELLDFKDGNVACLEITNFIFNFKTPYGPRGSSLIKAITSPNNQLFFASIILDSEISNQEIDALASALTNKHSQIKALTFLATENIIRIMTKTLQPECRLSNLRFSFGRINDTPNETSISTLSEADIASFRKALQTTNCRNLCLNDNIINLFVIYNLVNSIISERCTLEIIDVTRLIDFISLDEAETGALTEEDKHDNDTEIILLLAYAVVTAEKKWGRKITILGIPDFKTYLTKAEKIFYSPTNEPALLATPSSFFAPVRATESSSLTPDISRDFLDPSFDPFPSTKIEILQNPKFKKWVSDQYADNLLNKYFTDGLTQDNLKNLKLPENNIITREHYWAFIQLHDNLKFTIERTCDELSYLNRWEARAIVYFSDLYYSKNPETTTSTGPISFGNLLRNLRDTPGGPLNQTRLLALQNLIEKNYPVAIALQFISTAPKTGTNDCCTVAAFGR